METCPKINGLRFHKNHVCQFIYHETMCSISIEEKNIDLFSIFVHGMPRMWVCDADDNLTPIPGLAWAQTVSHVCRKILGPPRSHRPRPKAIPTAKTQPAQPRRRWALARELGKPRYALRHRGQRSKTRKCVLSFSWGRNYFIWYNYR